MITEIKDFKINYNIHCSFYDGTVQYETPFYLFRSRLLSLTKTLPAFIKCMF